MLVLGEKYNFTEYELNIFSKNFNNIIKAFKE